MGSCSLCAFPVNPAQMCHLKLWAITDFVITTMHLERCNKEVMRVNIFYCVVTVIYKLNGYYAQRRETLCHRCVF